MKDTMIWTAIVGAYVVVLGGFLFGMHRHWQRRNAQWDERHAAGDAEHGTQMAELARQRQLRQLEERRRGLRGREQRCPFCGAEGVWLGLSRLAGLHRDVL